MAGRTQGQPVEASSSNSGSRAEMSMEWVRSSRPVLKPVPPAAPQALSQPAASQTLPPEQPAPNTSPQVWSIELADKRLSTSLQRWAGAAGWLLVWEADRDFLYAIEVSMRALADTDYPLQASANPFTRVLRISRYQASGRR